jgi:glycosyltransferase involved in cell wall biosynthesis
MRIVHVSDVFAPGVGGIETFVQGLATRQVAEGHDVSVLTRTRGVGREPADLDVRRVPTSSGWGRLVDSADVVHVHLSVLSPLATLASRRAVASAVPTVASVHSLWVGHAPLVRAAAAAGGWDRAPILWTPVSAVAAAQVTRALPYARVHVVPNAVDVAWWRGLPAAAGPVPVFLTTMRLAARKRPLEFLRMIHSAKRELGDVPMRALIVGSGPMSSRLGREIRRLGLERTVLLAGERSPEEIRALCAQSYAYVAPATLESFGIAALEARAAGLPVVAMRRGGVGSFVQHGVEGVLCEDDDAMARALVTLLTDRARRDRMAAHNARVPPEADWADTVAAFVSAYEQAARLSPTAVGWARRASA